MLTCPRCGTPSPGYTARARLCPKGGKRVYQALELDRTTG
jgi:hypothetical protein